MELTIEQQAAIENGQAVEVVVGETRCVVVRREVFDRVKMALEELSPDETSQAVLASWDPDPGLDSYQKYRP